MLRSSCFQLLDSSELLAVLLQLLHHIWPQECQCNAQEQQIGDPLHCPHQRRQQKSGKDGKPDHGQWSVAMQLLVQPLDVTSDVGLNGVPSWVQDVLHLTENWSCIGLHMLPSRLQTYDMQQRDSQLQRTGANDENKGCRGCQ